MVQLRDRYGHNQCEDTRAALRDPFAIIARIGPQSLSTSSFAWMEQLAWEEEHFRYFCDFYQGVGGHQFVVSSRQSRRHGAAAMTPAGKWILKTSDGFLSAACGFIWTRNFRIFDLYLKACRGGWTGSNRDALSLLISSIIIAERPDMLRVIPDSPATAGEIEELAFGTPEKIWSPYSADAFLTISGCPPLQELVIQNISPQPWWETANGKADFKTLSYLRTRVGNAESRARAAAKPPRRGGLQRLLSGFLRWR